MKHLLLPILILFLLSGCASGRLSVNEGKAKFAIPFDFPNSPEQELRDKKMLEEMERLERQMDQGQEGSEASED